MLTIFQFYLAYPFLNVYFHQRPHLSLEISPQDLHIVPRFRDNCFQVGLVDLEMSVSNLNTGYEWFFHIFNRNFLSMKNLRDLMWQYLNNNTRDNPLIFIVSLSLWFFIFLVFNFLFILQLFKQFFNVLDLFGSIIKIFPQFFLHLFNIEQLASFLCMLVHIQLYLEGVAVKFLQFLLFLQQSSFHLVKYSFFNLSAPGDFLIHLALQHLFLFFPLLEQFLFSFLPDEISCFTHQIGDLHIWGASFDLQVANIFSQMVDKFIEVFPAGMVESYIMFVFGILFIEIFYVFRLARIFDLQHLYDPILQLFGIFFDMLFGIGGKFPQFLLVASRVQMAMVAIFISALLPANFAEIFQS